MQRSQEGPRNVRNYCKNRKSIRDIPCELKTPMTNIAKIAKITNVTKFQTQKKKGSQEGPRNVPKYRKNCKSNKDFSCYVKRLSNKYGKNSKNNKFNEILHLEREKVKKGFEMSANFAKFYTCKEERSRRASRCL